MSWPLGSMLLCHEGDTCCQGQKQQKNVRVRESCKCTDFSEEEGRLRRSREGLMQKRGGKEGNLSYMSVENHSMIGCCRAEAANCFTHAVWE